MRRVGAGLVSLALAAAPVLVLPTPAQAVAPPAGCATQRADQPVQVTITALPRTIQPGDQLTVDAKLLNCGTTPLTQIRVRMRTGEVLSTRTQLANADANPSDAVHAAGEWTDYSGTVPVGKTAFVRYQTTTAALALNVIGVYPVQFLVQADAGQGLGLTQVGEVRTYLPYFPDGAQQPTEVTWLLPFADRPHRLYEDNEHTLYDEALDTSIVGHGRLATMLYLAQRAAQAHVPYALAVDPDLADTVYQMSQGYRVVAGAGPVEGRGKQDATVWLNGLTGLAGGRDVIALPYADADLVALSSDGLTRLLPNMQDGARLLQSRLSDHPVRADIAWPAGGILNDEALDQLVSGTVSTVVLDPASMANPRPGVLTDSAASPLPAASRAGVALVADQQLDRIVTGQVPVAGGPRLLEQRYLAELAMITAEAPAVQRHVLIAPPHTWRMDPAAILPLMQDTVSVPYLRAGTLSKLAATPATQQVDRGALVYPQNAPRLQPNQLSALRRCVQVLDQLRSALDNRAEADLLGEFPRAMVRAASAAWRTSPKGGNVQLRPIFIRLGTLIDHQVQIIAPKPAKYSLAAQNSTLPLTVVNNLPVSITVTVHVEPRGTAGFHAEDKQVVLLGNGRRAQVRIPATVTQSGRFTVKAELITPDGHSMGGDPVLLEVSSTAYGTVALGITVGAFGLLLLLLLRRVIRQLRSGPATPVPAGSPAERGT
jgi:hypothetical protein